MRDRILQWTYRFRWAILTTLIVTVAVIFRVLWSGYSDLDIADQAREAGLEKTAIDYYGRAARWYCPVLGAHNEARDRLSALCWNLERANNDEMALRCFRELRGAVLSTRWLWTPHVGILDNANAGIVRTSLEKRPDGTPVIPKDRHLELLNRDLSPNPWLAFLAVILFFAWVGTTGLGAWRSTTPEGRVDWKHFAKYLGLSAVFLACWLLALRFA